MASAGRRTMFASSTRVACQRGLATRSPLRSLPSPYTVPRNPVVSMRPSFACVRAFSSTPSCLNTTPSSPAGPSSSAPGKVLATYEGPLARTFTRLKLFSLGSLGLASVLTPVLLLAPGEISLAGRIGLSITALATSGVSTALIAWIGTPYVGTMRLVSLASSSSPTSTASDKVVMQLNTVSWKLAPQQTLVYEPTFLRPTSRPFASWEITNNPPPLALPRGSTGEVEKLVAETFDVKSGTSLGKWIVKYSTETQSKDGEGSWNAVGKVEVRGKPTRYFNVHEELLDEDWQVLG